MWGHSKGQRMHPKKNLVVLSGNLFNDCKQGRWMQSYASRRVTYKRVPFILGVSSIIEQLLLNVNSLNLKKCINNPCYGPQVKCLEQLRKQESDLFHLENLFLFSLPQSFICKRQTVTHNFGKIQVYEYFIAIDSLKPINYCTNCLWFCFLALARRSCLSVLYCVIYCLHIMLTKVRWLIYYIVKDFLKE